MIEYGFGMKMATKGVCLEIGFRKDLSLNPKAFLFIVRGLKLWKVHFGRGKLHYGKWDLEDEFWLMNFGFRNTNFLFRN